jgi:putative hydrolase of the HAD superfamily
VELDPVRAVLFDSGGVLIGPRGGRWNPRFDFEQVVLRVAPQTSREDFAEAIAAGDELLDRGDGTPSRDAYHQVMLSALGIEASASLLSELDQPLDAAEVVELFPEVIEVLDELRRRGVRMAVVSDNWATLPELHAGLGLAGYFEVYAISEVLGCNKPDPRMYRHASDRLGLEPNECIFVDDHPPNVEAAIALGYRGLALLREGPLDQCTTSAAADLRALLQLVSR